MLQKSQTNRPTEVFYTVSNPWDFKYQPQLVNGGFLVAINSINPLVGLKKNLGGGFNYFLFSPLPGEMIQFDEHMFQIGWWTTTS